MLAMSTSAPFAGYPMPGHIISTRHVLAGLWPVSDLDRIEEARSLYNAGLAEMATARIGDQFVLYSIPRRVKAKPRNWFHSWDS